jgi:hypothetical protein
VCEREKERGRLRARARETETDEGPNLLERKKERKIERERERGTLLRHNDDDNAPLTLLMCRNKMTSIHEHDNVRSF